MLKSPEELKELLCLYTTNPAKIPLLSNMKWEISGCVKILELFEEITKKFSDSPSNIGDIIPHIVTLKVNHGSHFATNVSHINEPSSFFEECFEKQMEVKHFMTKIIKAEIKSRFMVCTINIHHIFSFLSP